VPRAAVSKSVRMEGGVFLAGKKKKPGRRCPGGIARRKNSFKKRKKWRFTKLKGVA